MKRLGSIGIGIAACAIGLYAAPAAFGAATTAVKGTVNVVPDPGNLSGVWISSRFNPDRDAERGGPRAGPAELAKQAKQENVFKQPPLLPWASAIIEQRRKDAAAGRPFAFAKARCLPAGTPGSMFPPAALPIQILETPGQITVLFEEFNQFRTIHMTAKHLADPDPGYFGDSIGHWEGATLVVDTIGINDKTTLGNLGVPHTEELHVVERIHRMGDTIQDDVTMTDPKTFVGEWKMRNTLKRVQAGRIHEYYCDNDRNTPDATGKSGVQLPPQS